MKRLYFTAAFAVLFFTSCAFADAEQDRQITYQQLETFSNVLSIMQENYVEDVDTAKAINGAINGMLSSLDPHSSYLQPEDFRELQNETKGSFSGIGIEITVKDGILTVVSPIEDTPAAKAGLQAGDQIIQVNGTSTKDMTLMEAVRLLRGKKGTDVTISVHKPSRTELEKITLTRAEIPLHSVKSMLLEPGLAYIRITNFQAATTRDFKKELATFEKEGPIEGLVLDLRNNPGGLLDQAIKIADVFLDEGVIVSTRGRNEEQNMEFEAHRDTGRYSFPIIVLVNEGSASASEIVAGALQDHERAILLGTATFGKGSVQTVIPMPGGAGLRLTTAKYFTPSGASIQATGIEPDVLVEFMPPKDDKDANVSSPREKDLPNHLPAKQQTIPAESDNITNNKQLQERLQRDNQLRTALIILKSLRIANTGIREISE